MQADLKRTADIGELWFYFFFLIQFSSHVFDRSNRGERNQRDGSQQHGVVLVLPVLASVVCWEAHHHSTSQISWRWEIKTLLASDRPRPRQPGLLSNSMMQGKNILTRIVPVTTSQNLNFLRSDSIFKLASYLFESICLHCFESIRLHFV